MKKTDDYSTLVKLLKEKAALEIEANPSAETFMGKPDRWWESPKWRCAKGHISSMYLKSEVEGALCLECHGLLVLTFPEDEEVEA